MGLNYGLVRENPRRVPRPPVSPENLGVRHQRPHPAALHVVDARVAGVAHEVDAVFLGAEMAIADRDGLGAAPPQEERAGRSPVSTGTGWRQNLPRRHRRRWCCRRRRR